MLSFVVQNVYTHYAQNNNKRLLALDRSFVFSPLPTNTHTHIHAHMVHRLALIHTHTQCKGSRYPLHIYRAIPNVRSRSKSRTESLLAYSPFFLFLSPFFAMNFIYQKLCMYIYYMATVLKGINDTQSASQWHSKSVSVSECAFRMYELRTRLLFG